MVLSTQRPSTTSASDAPAPRWWVTILGASTDVLSRCVAPARGPRVGETVEAVLADPELVAPLVWDGIGRRFGGEASVGGCVDAGDRRRDRRDGHRDVDPSERRRLVQRCQRRQGLEVSARLFVETSGFGESAAFGPFDAVSHRVELSEPRRWLPAPRRHHH
jgi:hypothetical protein